jgi:hypothetical protein
MADGELRVVAVQPPRVLELAPGVLVHPARLVAARPSAEDGQVSSRGDLHLHLEEPGRVAVALLGLLLVDQEEADHPQLRALPRQAAQPHLGEVLGGHQGLELALLQGDRAGLVDLAALPHPGGGAGGGLRRLAFSALVAAPADPHLQLRD